MRGDPTPVCQSCREYTPDSGHYLEAISAWMCLRCLPACETPNDREYLAAVDSLRRALQVAG